MSSLGTISKYLGVEFTRTTCGMLLHQTEYVQNILRQFGMADARPAFTPMPEGAKLQLHMDTAPSDATGYRQIVGKLIYLLHTRPDLSYAIHMVSKFMHAPEESHLQAVLGILRYLKRYPSLGLHFKTGDEPHLTGFSDANYGGDRDDSTSLGAYIFFLGATPITWKCRKQKSVSRSSCESEYRALAHSACEAIWLRSLLHELGFGSPKPTVIGCDNQSAIKLTKNPVFHEKTKHFKIDWHFSRQKVEEGVIAVEYISTQAQPADMLTKALGRTKFEIGRERLGLVSSEEANILSSENEESFLEQ